MPSRATRHDTFPRQSRRRSTRPRRVPRATRRLVREELRDRRFATPPPPGKHARRELMTPHSSVSVSPTTRRASTTGVRKCRVQSTASSRRRIRTSRTSGTVRGNFPHSFHTLRRGARTHRCGRFPRCAGIRSELVARPMLGRGERRTSVKNLYLCDPGTHPATPWRESPENMRRAKNFVIAADC